MTTFVCHLLMDHTLGNGSSTVYIYGPDFLGQTTVPVG